MKFNTLKKKKGFTLVEMLVSISLFTVVLTLSVSTLLVLIDANGRAQSMQLVMTNLTFSLDSMTREVRTGFNWYCGSSVGSPAIESDTHLADCDAGSTGNVISIIESGDSLTNGLSSKRVTYWHDVSDGSIKRNLGDGSNWVPLTGPEIVIDEMKIIMSGTARIAAGDTEQPTATIFIKGRAGVTATDPTGVKEREFDIETTVTQRLLDI